MVYFSSVFNSLNSSELYQKLEVCGYSQVMALHIDHSNHTNYLLLYRKSNETESASEGEDVSYRFFWR